MWMGRCVSDWTFFFPSFPLFSLFLSFRLSKNFFLLHFFPLGLPPWYSTRASQGYHDMRGDGTPHVLPPVTQKLMSKKKGEPQNYMFGEMRYVKKKNTGIESIHLNNPVTHYPNHAEPPWASTRKPTSSTTSTSSPRPTSKTPPSTRSAPSSAAPWRARSRSRASSS